MEETGYLDGFFGQVFQITDNVLSLPVKCRGEWEIKGRTGDVIVLLVCTRHIPCVVYHLLARGKKLI